MSNEITLEKLEELMKSIPEDLHDPLNQICEALMKQVDWTKVFDFFETLKTDPKFKGVKKFYKGIPIIEVVK